jgi:hypothetical protein
MSSGIQTYSASFITHVEELHQRAEPPCSTGFHLHRDDPTIHLNKVIDLRAGLVFLPGPVPSLFSIEINNDENFPYSDNQIMFSFMCSLLNSVFKIFTMLLLKKENEIYRRHLDLQKKRLMFTKTDKFTLAMLNNQRVHQGTDKIPDAADTIGLGPSLSPFKRIGMRKTNGRGSNPPGSA